MLVLSRRRDESIVVNDNILITVMGIWGDHIRLGIEAPGEIPIHRLEIWEAIQHERRLAESRDRIGLDRDEVGPAKVAETHERPSGRPVNENPRAFGEGLD